MSVENVTEVKSPGERFTMLGRIASAIPYIAIFLVTFLANIAFSFREGRLATVPYYDDVSYLTDAFDRLTFAASNGLWSLASSFWTDPPHAPTSTLTGMLGFWLFGPEPVAAYLANAWCLAIYVSVAAYLSRPMGAQLPRILFVAVLAFVPVSHVMVTEFRPDMVAGLVFAVALMATCATDFRTLDLKGKLILVGIAIAATVAKPSGIIVAIPGIGIAFVLTVVAQAVSSSDDRSWLLRNALSCLVLYALALVPFAILFGAHTVVYIEQVLFSNADIWTTPGDRWFHWTYHSIGEGATKALGPFGPLAFLIVAIDLVLFSRFRSYRRPGVLPLYATLVILYCAMSISNEKTIFQGSYFYLPLLLAAAGAFVRMAVASLLRWPEAAQFAIRGVLGVGLVLCVLFLPLVGAYSPRYRDQNESNVLMPKVAEALYALNRNEWQTSEACRERTMSVLVTSLDPFPAVAIRYAVAHGGLKVAAADTYFPRSLEEALKAVDDADVVFTIDPVETPRANAFIRISTMVPEIFQHLSEKPGTRKVQLGTYYGSPYWLFINRNCSG